MTNHNDNDEHLRDQTSFVTDSPHFFKIILSDTLQSGKLGIPEGFSRRFASDLSISKPALLKVPGGSTWPVEVEELDGRVWFCTGWQEFVDYYSIGYGHLLAFRYEAGSTFHVIIFDKSACEIDYPSQEEEADDVDDDIVELQTFDNLEPFGPKSEVGGSRGSVEHSKCKASAPVQVLRDHTLPLPPPLPLEAASGFESKHPFFKLVIRPSYLGKSRRTANLPRRFLERHIPINPPVATLRHEDRSWRVTLKNYYYRGGNLGFFSAGWPAFVRGAHLMKGDVCLFELVDPKDCMFRVSIFRRSEGM